MQGYTTMHMLYGRKALPASLRIQNKAYVIAFPLKTIATKAKEYIYDTTTMNVTHHIATTSEKINETLAELGIDPRKYNKNHTYSDEEAYLHILKNTHKHTQTQSHSLSQLDTVPCTMMERSIVDIVMYPLVKNIGLIIPFQIISDTSEELVLDTRLIEPAGHMELFRKDLEKLL